jgi:hypothetical protein
LKGLAITTATNSYSPKLNPQENLWNEIRETIKNYDPTSTLNLDEAVLYIEQNQTLVEFITSLPYIARSL